MRWAGGVLLLVLVLVAPGEAAVSCRSGAALYEQDGVRIFETVDREELPTWWACSRRVRSPRKLLDLSPGVTNSLWVSRQDGDRLLFAVESFADGGGGWEAGWFDVRRGGSAIAAVDTASRGDFRAAPIGLDVDGRGDLAYALPLFDDEDEEQSRHLVHRRYLGQGRFAKERRLGSFKPAEVEPDTIRLDGGELAWREVGPARRLDIPAGSPAGGKAGRRATRAACRAGTTVYDFGARLFTTGAGTFICTGGKRPRISRLSSRKLAGRAYTDEDTLLGFAAGDRLYRLRFRTGELVSGRMPAGPDGSRPRVRFTAVGASGVAAVTERPSILLLAPDGRVRELATLGPEEILPSSLRIARTSVTWRALGAPRRIALTAAG